MTASQPVRAKWVVFMLAVMVGACAWLGCDQSAKDARIKDFQASRRLQLAREALRKLEDAGEKLERLSDARQAVLQFAESERLKSDQSTDGQTKASAARERLGELQKSAAAAESGSADSLAAAKEAIHEATIAVPPTIHQGAFAAVFILFLLVFPASAIAFRWMEVPLLNAQLSTDRRLLGYRTSPESTTWGMVTVAGHRWSAWHYLFHCTLAGAAVWAGAYLFFRHPDAQLDINTQRAMQLGFLGAYVFSLNLIYRRYTTRDLQPHVYMACAIGLLLGMIFNFVAFTAISGIASTNVAQASEFSGMGAGIAAVVAFAIGYFPNLAIHWFGEISRNATKGRARRSDELTLSLIDGISELHESRLRDEGIDNIQNLAAADIDDLVEKTPYSAQQIVEWIDQAVLYLYLDRGEIESFRKAGVRSVSDFRDVWNSYTVRFQVLPDGTVERIPAVLDEFDEHRRTVAQQLATTELRMDSLFRATTEGPNMDRVRTYWTNTKLASVEARQMLVDQISGRVGRTLRDKIRSGGTTSSAEILSLILDELFHQSNLRTPETNTAELLYGQAYLKKVLGNIDEARRLFQLCIDKFPDDPVAYNDLAWMDLHTLTQKGDWENARSNANNAIRLAKKNKITGFDLAAYHDTLALAELKLGRLAECGENIKEAISILGADKRLLDTLNQLLQAYVATNDAAKLAEARQLLDGISSAQNPADVKTSIDNLRKAHKL